MLREVWTWVNSSDENRKIIKENDDLSGALISGKVPPEVALNHTSAFFFVMEDDLKRGDIVNFEPFVAYRLRTEDWENDIRRITFPFIDKFKKMPREIRASQPLGKPKLMDHNVLAGKALGLNQAQIELMEHADTITWVYLQQYHLELLRRENFILSLPKHQL